MEISLWVLNMSRMRQSSKIVLKAGADLEYPPVPHEDPPLDFRAEMG